MLGFRLSSLLAWAGALVLFFLPWVDIRCQSRDGRVVSRVTLSGAQLAWGGATARVEGEPTRASLVDVSTLWQNARRLVAGCLLTGYFLGLVVGIPLALSGPPGAARAGAGLVLALVLGGLLLAAALVCFGNPFRAGGRFVSSVGVVDTHFTGWYFASYLANGWAAVSFALEYRVARG